MASFTLNAEMLKSTTQPTKVNPAMITFFNNAELSNTSVTTVATLIGGIWKMQEVSVSIGYQEEAQETYTVNTVGEILNLNVSQAPNGDLGITITSGTGPFNVNQGMFEEGYTEYYLFVKADQNGNTDHGYRSEAELTTSYFSLKK